MGTRSETDYEGFGKRWLARITTVIHGANDVPVLVAPPGFGGERLHNYLSTNGAQTGLHPQMLGPQLSPEVAAQHADKAKVVLFSRTIPRIPDVPITVIGPDELALRRPELEELAALHGLPSQLAQTIGVVTGGWGSAVEACLRQARQLEISDPAEVDSRLRSGIHLQPLIDRCIGRLNTKECIAAGVLARFETITESMVPAVGGRDHGHLQQLGLPLIPGPGGTFRILEPIRSALRTTGGADDQAMTAAISALEEDLGIVAASEVLLRSEMPNEAASLLRAVSIQQLNEANQSALEPILRTLLDSTKDDGLIGLHLARVLFNQGLLEEQRPVLEQAASSARELLHFGLAVEADAALLALDCWGLAPDVARARLAALSAEAVEHSSTRGRIRLDEVKYALQIEAGDLSELRKAATSLERVAAEWSLVGESSRASATRRMLASTALYHLGRYAEAQQLMDQSALEVGDQPQSLLRCLSLQSRMAALAGRLDDFQALADETASLQKSVGVPWIGAYLNWSRMIDAGHRGQAQQVATLESRVQADAGGLLQHTTGVVFAADAMLAHTLTGQFARAEKILQDIQPRRTQAPLEVAMAELVLRSRQSPGQAQTIADSLLRSVDVPVERMWRVHLELALAQGLPPTRLDEIREEAAAYDLEPLYERLIRSHRDSAIETSATILVLGTFAVVDSQGIDIPVRSQKARELLKLLAVQGRPIRQEVIVDTLWPDASAALGKQRLKNVLRRARLVVGVEGVLRIDDTITLGETVRTDVAEVVELSSRTSEDVHAKLRALQLARGPLLPDDIYSDWIRDERIVIQSRLETALADLLAGRSIEPMEAVDYFERLEFDSTAVLLQIATLAADTGEAKALTRCLALLSVRYTNLGLEPPDQYQRLAARAAD